jgi:hypothetical protein
VDSQQLSLWDYRPPNYVDRQGYAEGLKKRGRATPSAVRALVLERDAYVCAYCGDDATVVDHITPYSYRHDHSPENLVAACEECNALASDFMFPTFEEKSRYIRDKRAGRVWRRSAIIAYCTECGCNFKPRVRGATRFLCAQCAIAFT